MTGTGIVIPAPFGLSVMTDAPLKFQWSPPGAHYPHDHRLFLAAKTTNEAGSILTAEGNNISEWYNNNLLQWNLVSGHESGPEEDSRNYPKDVHIVINDTVIEQKSEITLVGVNLDDRLSFSSHVRNVCRKASCQTGVLIRLHNLIPTSAKLLIVKFAIDYLIS